ncbi:transmembrane protein 132C-like [Arapaima gigas]
MMATGRQKARLQKVLQVDLELDGLLEPLGSRSVTWQVEYLGTRESTEKIETQIHLAHEELGGIVPLAMVSVPTAEAGGLEDAGPQPKDAG